MGKAAHTNATIQSSVATKELQGSLGASRINANQVYHNPSPAFLYKMALQHEHYTGTPCAIASTGALIAYSGEKTGRSPKDKRLVKEPSTENDINWGDINIPMAPASFQRNLDMALAFLNSRSEIYVVDGFAGWDPDHQIKVRIICARPYHALFMTNMLIRPNQEDLANFGEPDWVIYNAGQCPADPTIEDVSSTASVAFNFDSQQAVILGTEYAGCMKKGVFTILNYQLPKKGILSMHCSANVGDDGDTALFFGLSGTGKTTLSAHPSRQLIGDDEHGWTDNGIFNIEGGCYAKTIRLSEEGEPDIWQAIRFGSVLENVVYDPHTHHVDYDDDSLTENTRVSYPIEYMPHVKKPCMAGQPTNVFFLTCDAYGVLPPISKLTPEQAMLHFVSGYTAKVAGTEMGVKEPQATFSGCFGEAFMVWHPMVYAELLKTKMAQHNTNVWLVNTGWTGGAYGTGERMSLPHTRALLDAALDGELANVAYDTDPIFGLAYPTECPGVPSEILNPKAVWADKAAYDKTANHLAELFNENFARYADQASAEVLAARPKVLAGV